VPEGNEGRCPPTTRTLAGGQARPTFVLAQRPRGDRKVDHRSDIRRDYVRRGETWREFLLLARFRGQKQHSSNLPNTCTPTRISVPLFREQLLQVLRANPGIGRQSLCSQLEKVIVGPFKATRISTLIIIDALDECKDVEPASAILSMLSRYVDEIPDRSGSLSLVVQNLESALGFVLSHFGPSQKYSNSMKLNLKWWTVTSSSSFKHG
jgi:hypothetical protein